MRIFKAKCERDGLYAHAIVLHAAAERLRRKRNLPRFGNAREVDILVSTAQAKAIKRNRAVGETLVELVVQDVIDPTAINSGDGLGPLEALYKVEWIRERIVKMQRNIKVARRDKRPVPKLESYIFVGNSGTGKTTVARVMAEVLSSPDVNLLSKPEVVVRSASDLKGAYIGKAQENVRSAMEAATGGVLFIDEAYDLAGGPYGQEALTQLVNMMTEQQHLNKTMVILAGYKTDMDQMLSGNQGARSRFGETWEFPDWDPDDCAGFICKSAEKDGIFLVPDSSEMHALREGFKALSGFDVEVLEFDGRRSTERQARPGWANARDVVAVYDKMMAARNDRVCDEAEEMPRFVATDVQTAINEMLLHRPEGLSRRKMHEDASAWFHLTEHLNLNSSQDP